MPRASLLPLKLLLPLAALLIVTVALPAAAGRVYREALGENIGDLGGISLAYRAYKLSLGGKPAPVIGGLTGDQRFFMAYAQVFKVKMREAALRQQLLTDPHSPGQFRVNGIVRNIDEWYKAFNVKPTDKLYLPPEKRLRIW